MEALDIYDFLHFVEGNQYVEEGITCPPTVWPQRCAEDEKMLEVEIAFDAFSRTDMLGSFTYM